jgi:hypothetical protein
MGMDAVQKERIKHIIRYIDYDVLTDWESKFIESIEEQFYRKNWLSDAQINKLEEVFRESNER